VYRNAPEGPGDRRARLLLWRRVALAVCLALSAADDFAAVTVVGPSPASHLAAPLSLLTTGVAALCFGMWAGIVVAGALGVCAALLPNAENGLALAIVALCFGGLAGRVRDVTIAADAARTALLHAEQRFRAITEDGADLVLIFDSTGNATYANEAHVALLGRSPGAMLRSGFYDAFGPSGVIALTEAFATTPPGISERLELVARHSDGTTRILEATLRNATLEPAVAGFILHARDVSAVKNAENRLIAATAHDTLTQLPNRTTMTARLDEMLAERGDKQIALLLLDVDRFKDVNDVLGHPAGDDLLVQIAARLVASIRDGDLVARIGGDEFAIVLGRTKDASEAAVVAARIRATVTAPYELIDRDIVVGASVGVALAELTLDATMLLRRADVAMHAAKRRRDGVSTFSKLQDERAKRRLTMASALHAAIANDEFVLHFQPQLDLRTGSIRAAEALVRWEHPERGFLYPEFFLPIAVEVGEMDRLTDWILLAALKRVRRWTRAGHGMRVCVNLSAYDLRDDRLAEVVPRLLAQTAVGCAGSPSAAYASRSTISVPAVRVSRTCATSRSMRSQNRSTIRDQYGTGSRRRGDRRFDDRSRASTQRRSRRRRRGAHDDAGCDRDDGRGIRTRLRDRTSARTQRVRRVDLRAAWATRDRQRLTCSDRRASSPNGRRNLPS
jgi:diguanylate cyclase (GGDEF)-like protein/PAS domain S-box-containing protein